MNWAIVLMFLCMAIGLGSDRLGRRRNMVMGAAIILFVAHAYLS